MRVDEFDYELPEELIAQEPLEPRDGSRLMVLDRRRGRWEHARFRDLAEILQPGDCLVLNDTRVRPARLIGRRDSGGRVELLLLRPLGEDRWEVLGRPARKLRAGSLLLFGAAEAGQGERLEAEVLENRGEGVLRVRFRYRGEWERLLERLGQVPLPPYIRRPLEDPERYQTVYAREPGSAAAPTAGLHFTPELLERLRERGVEQVKITLHVGIDTFRPVLEEEVERHRMHAEFFTVSEEAAEAINRARAAGGRRVAVGTTVVRTLESVADPQGRVRPARGWTDLFIYPGYRYRAVDALLTNFHLPRSTLLMLVSAFAGRDLILAAYREAVGRRYRFFSFGDAMLIL
ncbi:MAG: tRNA preQ1(34) S-adenosylmethionine ribosyltransferase-isomerase QueA [Bacillota bacterium]|nr:tRNA preQ1(34) S-adenosylmethionine ribosyltransferase-isomerase QueA [Bacillota bacterium]